MAPSSPKPSCTSTSKSLRHSRPSPSSASSVVHRPTNNRRVEKIRSIRETFARAYTSQAYLCTNCGKPFYCPQALGGHRNAHNREKKFKQENLPCARPIPRYPFPSNPTFFARNVELNPKPVQYFTERNVTSQPSLNFKEIGIAHPYLSNHLNDPNKAANHTIPLTIQMASFPYGFDSKGNHVLDTFTPPKEFPPARNFVPLRNPNTAARNLTSRFKESVPITSRNPRLGIVAPLPTGGNNGATYYLSGVLAASPAMAAGGVDCGEEPNPMGLDLDLHL